jgi:hypothetical protein
MRWIAVTTFHPTQRQSNLQGNILQALACGGVAAGKGMAALDALLTWIFNQWREFGMTLDV